MGRSHAAEARRSEITEIVTAVGFMRIDDLADRFQVTPMTIHRDLDELDARGVLTKVRSGARATPIEQIERNVQLRQNHMLPEKRAVGRAALSWLSGQEGTKVVALDDSTTVLATVDDLARREDLTIVTNFLAVIERVASAGGASLFALGGSLSPEFQSFLGPTTREAISSIQIDVFLLSATSIGRGAVYHPNESALLVKQALIAQATQSVLLMDHTKFTRRALHRMAGLHEFDAVIVDDGIDPEDEEWLRESVRQLIVAPVTEEDS